jgi:hypothetical protein
MTPLPSHASLAALWGAMFAVVVMFGMDIAKPGMSVALIDRAFEVVNTEVSSQMASIGAALEHYSPIKVKAYEKIEKEPRSYRFERKTYHAQVAKVRKAMRQDFRNTNIFYNKEVLQAIKDIELRGSPKGRH